MKKSKNYSPSWRKSLLRIRATQGFTLIELLVVVIIIGTLAAIGLPSLIRQVEKARASEAKNNLGAINRAQQAYMFEKATFATALDDLGLDLTVGSYNGSFYETPFYQYAVTGTPTSTEVHHLAQPQPKYSSDLKIIGGSVFRVGNIFQSVICEADDVSVTPVIADGDTCNDGIILE